MISAAEHRAVEEDADDKWTAETAGMEHGFLMKTYGRLEVYFQAFLTPTLYGYAQQIHVPAVLLPVPFG